MQLKKSMVDLFRLSALSNKNSDVLVKYVTKMSYLWNVFLSDLGTKFIKATRLSQGLGPLIRCCKM